MGFFSRETKDGKRTAGYGIYLVGGLLASGAIVYLHRQLLSPAVPPRNQQMAPPKVPAIAQPAARLAPVDASVSQATQNRSASYRLRPDGDRPGRPSEPPAPETAVHDSFDAINLALQQPASDEARADGREGRPFDETGGSAETREAFSELPPAFPPQAGGSTAESPGRGAQLFGYRDSAADFSGTPQTGRSESAAEPAIHVVPKGTLICVFLLTTVDTGDPSATIQFGAAKPLVFNHRHQLPFGTRFLGKLSGAPVRNRVSLAADTILYPDGLERPIAASAVEADAAGSNIRPGIAAYFFPPPQWAQISPYVADFITGYMGLLQSRAEAPISANIGGVSLQAANTTDPLPPLYQASGQAIQAFTQARLKDIEQRYATHYLVPAGAACWLQLDRDLDLGRAPISGESTPASTVPLSRGETSK